MRKGSGTGAESQRKEHRFQGHAFQGGRGVGTGLEMGSESRGRGTVPESGGGEHRI